MAIRLRRARRWAMMASLTAVAAVGVSSVPALGSASSSADPWYGVPTPPASADVTRSVDWETDLEPAPFPFAEQDTRGRGSNLLEGDLVESDVNRIVAFSRESRQAGEPLWGRLSGMPAFNRTVAWTVDQFRAAGIRDSRVERFPSPPLWLPKSFELRLEGDAEHGTGSQDVVLQSAFPQTGGAPIPGGALSAPMVYVGHGTTADLIGRDVTGKVAVLRINNEQSLFHAPERGVPDALVKRGAVGVVTIVDGPGNMQYFDNRFACGSAPCFTIGGQDGAFLEQVLGQAGQGEAVRLRMSLDSERRAGLTSSNGVAVIPGRSGKNIIINTHADGFFDGAGDNADGLATLIAAARWSAQQKRPEHTLIFVASAGHHSAVNGPREFVAAHPDLMRDTLLVLNIEHVAQLDVMRAVNATTDGGFDNAWVPTVAEEAKHAGVSNLAPFVIDLWQEGVTRFGFQLDLTVDTRVPGELGGYASAGKPMTQAIAAGVLYHSSGDTVDSISTPGLKKAARFHAHFIEQVAQAPVQAFTAGGTTPSAAALRLATDDGDGDHAARP